MGAVGRWNGVSRAYRRSFATLCAGTISEVLAVLPQGKLLDVGCGSGDLLDAAIARAWEVTGVDADIDMVVLSQLIAPGRVVQAALPKLPFANGVFDAVVANFVLNHVEDPRAALQEIARVTSGGGKVAATIWPPNGAGWNTLVGSAFKAAQPRQPAPTIRAPHLDFERSAAGLAGITSDAGLKVVQARELVWQWQISPEDLWIGISGGVATVGQTYLAQDQKTRDQIRQEFFARAKASAVNGVLTFTNRAVFVVGQR